MLNPPLQLEGTWEEIVAQLPHVEGQRLHVIVYSENPNVAAPKDNRPIAEVLAEIAQGVPREEWDRLPADFSAQLDHYIYGSPKR